MPKISMEFDCPEELDELMTALHGIDYKIGLWDVSQWARNAQKYGHEFKTPDEVIERLREIIFEICRERNISLD